MSLRQAVLLHLESNECDLSTGGSTVVVTPPINPEMILLSESLTSCLQVGALVLGWGTVALEEVRCRESYKGLTIVARE